MFNAEKFCIDNRIDTATSGKHYRKGWVNIACPFCSGSPGHHGGFAIKDPRFTNGYKCWRCGWHWLPKVISRILNIPVAKAIDVINSYSEGEIKVYPKEKIKRPTRVALPTFSRQLRALPMHRKYLLDRGFPAYNASYKYDITGTIHCSDYPLRLVFPITIDQALVSFTTRDITGKAKQKYLGPKFEEEVIPHMEILYGLDQVKPNLDKIIIVEGVLDAIKLNGNAVATFGTQWTRYQAKLIMQRFEKAVILYDNDEAGNERGIKLSWFFDQFNFESEVINLNNCDDPASMSAKDKRDLLKWFNDF